MTTNAPKSEVSASVTERLTKPRTVRFGIDHDRRVWLWINRIIRELDVADYLTEVLVAVEVDGEVPAVGFVADGRWYEGS